MSKCGIYSTKYEDELIFARTPFQKICLILGLVFLLSIPWIASPYYMVVLIFIYIAIIGAIGLNILTGFAGQISLGQAALLAVGAYTAGALAVYLGFPFLLAIIVSGLVTAGFGAIIGIPSLRIKGFYLAITTLLAHYIVFFILHLPWVAPHLGVPHGFLLPPVSFGPIKIPPAHQNFFFYYFTLGSAAFATWTAANLMRSKLGRAFVAIRDNDNVASVLGINVFRYKLLAFIISSFYVGVAGAIYAFYVRQIVPGHFDIRVTIDYIAMILVGGLGRIWGSILGAVIIILLSEFLRLFTTVYISPIFPELVAYVEALKLILYGGIIIFMVIVEPLGVVALLRRVKEYFKLWPFRYF